MEEIDDLINNASEHEEYSIQDGDWDQLQSMLNKHDRRKKIGWIWRGTVVLTLIVAGLLFVNKGSLIDEGMEEIINITESEKLEKNGIEEKVNDDLAATLQGTLIAGTKGNTQSITQVEEQAYSEPVKDKRTDTGEKLIEESKQALGNTNENLAAVIIDNNHQLKATAKVVVDLSLVQEPNLNLINSEEEETSEQEITEIVHPDTVVPDPLTTEVELQLLTENAENEPLAIDSVDSNAAMKKTANRKVHIYFGIGTEWSVISQRSVGTAKLKLQIGGEYQFLNKWSVLSGVNYTVKDYQTNVEDYAVKQGFWTNGIKPNSISAECKVIEIPLNFRYYFAAQDSMRSSFYLMVGASSYLMASERYSFTYDVEDPTLKQEWNGEWENIHYFSVLNLSAGYQKSLQRNWSVLVEPYVILPLTGIGFGQVDLISFGLSLQLKY